MITVAFIAFAAYLFFGDAATQKLKTLLAERPIDRKHLAAGVLLVAALVSLAYRPAPANPMPQPVPSDTFSLRGKFTGPTAADDAAMLSALLAELADCIEQDGAKAEPRLRTGVALDDLRIAAREARMKGESLGARQPRVREAIHLYLDQAVGTSGGPVTPESRRAWIVAFRDLSKACAEAAQ